MTTPDRRRWDGAETLLPAIRNGKDMPAGEGVRQAAGLRSIERRQPSGLSPRGSAPEAVSATPADTAFLLMGPEGRQGMRLTLHTGAIRESMMLKRQGCIVTDVDVVIPLYNCAEFIEQAIRSVQEQTVPVRTIIVVNDGSTDAGLKKVAAMAAKDKRILLLNGPNQGASAARNRGILAARSPLVAFLDADDFWKPDKIARQLAVMEQGGFSFSHTLAEAVDEQGHPVNVPLYAGGMDIPPTFDNIRLGLYPVVGSASAVLTWRDLLLRAGLFAERENFGEDWDMWARLAQYGPVARVDSPLVSIRIRLSSVQHSMSAETWALSRLHSRILVARHWEDDPEFLRAHERAARPDLWAVMRWRLSSPASMRELYHQLHGHRHAAGRVLARTPWDFFRVLLWGCGTTLRKIMTSPSELLRLWRRLRAERAR